MYITITLTVGWFLVVSIYHSIQLLSLLTLAAFLLICLNRSKRCFRDLFRKLFLYLIKYKLPTHVQSLKKYSFQQCKHVFILIE